MQSDVLGDTWLHQSWLQISNRISGYNFMLHENLDKGFINFLRRAPDEFIGNLVVPIQ
jgi:hypothetical protein